MLVGVWERSGRIPAQLQGHTTGEPERLAWIWRWLNEIPSPITWSEISAWGSCSGIQVERWEGVLLIRLDRLMRRL